MITLFDYGVIFAKDDILLTINSIAKKHKITFFIIEQPEFYGGRGLIAHASGRIGKLYRIEGAMVGMLMQLGKVWEITPTQWKGNLPKEKTTAIVNDIFGLQLNLSRVSSDSDIGDAIALGSRVLGYW